jgi:prophage regulatory protein
MPKPIKIGPRAVAVPETEVAAVNTAVIRGAGEAEIRRLVTDLHAQRTVAA